MRPDETPAAPKRFYERAEAVREGGAYVVQLGGRTARSPGRRALSGPRALAEAMAAEWAAQGERLDMNRMPLTRLHGRFLDADDEAQALWTDIPVRFAGTDLLCYRSDEPGLAKREAEVWQPYLDRACERLDARFAVTEGIVAVEQDEAVLRAVRDFVDRLPLARRYALMLLTEITGSAVLAMSVLAGDDADAAFDASRLDERHQAERWGEDAEAKDREARLRADFADVVRYCGLA